MTSLVDPGGYDLHVHASCDLGGNLGKGPDVPKPKTRRAKIREVAHRLPREDDDRSDAGGGHQLVAVGERLRLEGLPELLTDEDGLVAILEETRQPFDEQRWRGFRAQHASRGCSVDLAALDTLGHL